MQIEPFGRLRFTARETHLAVPLFLISKSRYSHYLYLFSFYINGILSASDSAADRILHTVNEWRLERGVDRILLLQLQRRLSAGYFSIYSSWNPLDGVLICEM